MAPAYVANMAAPLTRYWRGWNRPIRWAVRMGRAGATSDRALDILRERYARGEIDKDEFEAKKQDLR